MLSSCFPFARCTFFSCLPRGFRSNDHRGRRARKRTRISHSAAADRIWCCALPGNSHHGKESPLSLFNKLRRLVYTNVVCVCHRRPINLLLSHSLIVLCIIRLHLSCREKRTHMTSPSVANLRRDFSEQDTLHQVHYMSSQWKGVTGATTTTFRATSTRLVQISHSTWWHQLEWWCCVILSLYRRNTQMLPPRQAPLWPNLLQNVYTTSPERTVSMTSVYAHTLECKSDPWQYSIYIRGSSVVHIADNRVCLNIRWLMLGTGQCEKKTLFLWARPLQCRRYIESSRCKPGAQIHTQCAVSYRFPSLFSVGRPSLGGRTSGATSGESQSPSMQFSMSTRKEVVIEKGRTTVAVRVYRKVFWFARRSSHPLRNWLRRPRQFDFRPFFLLLPPFVVDGSKQRRQRGKVRKANDDYTENGRTFLIHI